MASSKAGQMAKGRKKQATQQTANSQQDAASLLKADHRKVEALFQQFKEADDDEKAEIVHKICNELVVHTLLEEEIFYPACREKNVEDDMLDEAQVEHDGAKMLINQLMEEDQDDEFYDAHVTVLSEYIKHHVAEEEKPDDGIIAKAQKKGVDMVELGRRLKARKMELMQKAQAGRLGPPQPKSLNFGEMEQQGRYQFERERSRGRESDRYRRGREDEDDYREHRGSGGRYGDRSRSAQSRGDDDDRAYRGRSSRDDEGRGWYGDSRGHAQAAREGWERSGSRSRDDDDDRDRGGWFGDSRGHAEAARRGWRNRD